ncbi:hypothetical protein [Nocardia aurantiaca]|uniref:Uncharacterized protein n=1 Tax=Nocardia aurantiaca TaxID=2675850 RepID=A0A6I3KXR8_9NOCA|nr:hypothetical protein [Nocardia aurantiaca]MTE13360.1 hypothetical protein [Nocardia aurantiaca]
MKLRIAGVLGAAAVAGMVAVLVQGTAGAATGTLVSNGRVLVNPTGCVRILLTDLSTTVVSNGTDQDATFYASIDCSGDPIGTVAAGTDGTPPMAGSFMIN